MVSFSKLKNPAFFWKLIYFSVRYFLRIVNFPVEIYLFLEKLDTSFRKISSLNALIFLDASGFKGENCTEIVDPCEGHRCYNGGNCTVDNLINNNTVGNISFFFKKKDISFFLFLTKVDISKMLILFSWNSCFHLKLFDPFSVLHVHPFRSIFQWSADEGHPETGGEVRLCGRLLRRALRARESRRQKDLSGTVSLAFFSR